MPRNRDDTDPYAPPPRYKERSGAVMRFIILAALLGAAAWGYVEFSNQQQTASLNPPASQELADSGYQAAPTPEAAPPGSAPAATPPATARTTPPTPASPAPATSPSGDSTPG